MSETKLHACLGRGGEGCATFSFLLRKYAVLSVFSSFVCFLLWFHFCSDEWTTWPRLSVLRGSRSSWHFHCCFPCRSVSFGPLPLSLGRVSLDHVIGSTGQDPHQSSHLLVRTQSHSHLLSEQQRNSIISQVVVKSPLANAGDARGEGLIAGLERLPGGGHGNPFQYSCLENSMDRGGWQATVHGLQRAGHDWATEHTHRIISHKHPQSHSRTEGLTFLLFEGIVEDRSEVSVCVLLLLCQGSCLLQVTKNANT